MEELFKDFNPASAADWKARLEKDLKGITFDQLSVTDRNGITIRPFYDREDITGLQEPGLTRPDWSICAQVKVTTAVTANSQALSELNNGASGILFIIEADTDPEILLRDIELLYIYTCFRISKNALAFASRLRTWLAAKGWDQGVMDCFITYDFIGHFLQQGQWQGNREQEEQTFIAFLETTEGMAHLCIDASLFQNAGATSIYELACALAQVNEYLTLLETQKKTGRINKIHITLATDTAYFEQIAKLRAFRNLLDLLLEQYLIRPQVHLHLETSNVYRSPFDSYSNLLRDAIAAMAAVAGGCNSLYIHPFDESRKAPDDFSRRMSRNQQLIFKEESYLDKVADVAAGSYYLETLTDQIAEKAWQQFKEIEGHGGLIAAFDQGMIKANIEAQATQLVQDYKEGKRVLIGVNKFPNPKDEPRPLPVEHRDNRGLNPLLLAQEIMEQKYLP